MKIKTNQEHQGKSRPIKSNQEKLREIKKINPSRANFRDQIRLIPRLGPRGARAGPNQESAAGRGGGGIGHQKSHHTRSRRNFGIIVSHLLPLYRHPFLPTRPSPASDPSQPSQQTTRCCHLPTHPPIVTNGGWMGRRGDTARGAGFGWREAGGRRGSRSARNTQGHLESNNDYPARLWSDVYMLLFKARGAHSAGPI